MRSKRNVLSFDAARERLFSPFPGAYSTGSDAQAVLSTRLVVVLLAFAAVLTGALLFMLVSGVH
ncbi:hypothetical protein [Paraburkholderia acidiphila]|uniref:Uncharacterized protein n=1 Tax=Paraburkholderia acidiphila TaxID=2571747 RepID=A0A7Z2G9P3_9BURK|nr:hypothetical protein [Paraburkholderia acidiphila]QGZ57701.1 hypothetical protein FAZ97_22680 [Paraburkholderia acidiphila]